MAMSCLIVLISGCAKITNNTFCDVSSDIMFGSSGIVEYLLEHDEVLIRDILKHNETRSELCKNHP